MKIPTHEHEDAATSLLWPHLAVWSTTGAAFAVSHIRPDGWIEGLKVIALLLAILTSIVVFLRQLGQWGRERKARALSEVLRAAQVKCSRAIAGDCPAAEALDAELEKLEKKRS